MHKYPAGAEMGRGGVLILYSRHSEGLCVFPHKLGVLILQITSSCWWFAFFSVLAQRQANFQKTVILQWVLFLIEFAYAYSGVEILLAGFSCVTSWPLVCRRARTSSSPPTPTHQFPSITHVCKCKEHHHPQPTPPISCVASHMCASARNIIIPTHPHPSIA